LRRAHSDPGEVSLFLRPSRLARAQPPAALLTPGRRRRRRRRLFRLHEPQTRPYDPGDGRYVSGEPLAPTHSAGRAGGRGRRTGGSPPFFTGLEKSLLLLFGFFSRSLACLGFLENEKKASVLLSLSLGLLSRALVVVAQRERGRLPKNNPEENSGFFRRRRRRRDFSFVENKKNFDLMSSSTMMMRVDDVSTRGR